MWPCCGSSTRLSWASAVLKQLCCFGKKKAWDIWCLSGAEAGRQRVCGAVAQTWPPKSFWRPSVLPTSGLAAFATRMVFLIHLLIFQIYLMFWNVLSSEIPPHDCVIALSTDKQVDQRLDDHKAHGVGLTILVPGADQLACGALLRFRTAWDSFLAEVSLGLSINKPRMPWPRDLPMQNGEAFLFGQLRVLSLLLKLCFCYVIYCQSLG